MMIATLARSLAHNSERAEPVGTQSLLPFQMADCTTSMATPKKPLRHLTHQLGMLGRYSVGMPS
jgi:hypothetical protein